MIPLLASAAASILFNFSPTWKSEAVATVNSLPNLAGLIIEVCVEKDCTTIDRSDEVTLRDGNGEAAGVDKSVAVEKPFYKVEPPKEDAEKSMSRILGDVLGQLSGAHGKVSVQFTETTKGGATPEHTVNVNVTIEASTGSKK